MSAKRKLTLVSDVEHRSGCARSTAPSPLPGRSHFRAATVDDIHGWNTAVDDFLTHKSARCEPKTVLWYRERLAVAKAWLSHEGRNGAGVPLSDFRAKDLDQYLVHRITDTNPHTGEPILASTRRADAVAIKAFIKWCRKEGLMEVNPVADYEVPRADKPYVPTPKAATIARVLTACQERWSVTHNRAVRFLSVDSRSFYKRRNYAILAGLTAGGVRIGEMLALHVDDIDIDARVLTVRKAKGNSWREVPFESEWVEPLKAWLKVRPSCSSPLLFFTAYGEPIVYKQFLHSFRKDCAFAGVKGLTLHMLRGTGDTGSPYCRRSQCRHRQANERDAPRRRRRRIRKPDIHCNRVRKPGVLGLDYELPLSIFYPLSTINSSCRLRSGTARDCKPRAEAGATGCGWSRSRAMSACRANRLHSRARGKSVRRGTLSSSPFFRLSQVMALRSRLQSA